MINSIFKTKIFLFSLITSSCIVYHPQTVDIPLIKEKGDLRVDAGVSLIPSAHATVSYGLSDKLAIQGFGSVGADERYYFQGATGIYKELKSNVIMETYAGFGYGHGNAYSQTNGGSLKGNYQLYFAQINYGKISKLSAYNLDGGISIKMGYLHSNLTDRNFYYPDRFSSQYETYIDESILLEPAGMIRFGGNNLRLSLKLGGTVIYKFTHSDQYLPNSYLNIGIGINYNL